MYHYTESGLQNVWLKNGYVIHNTPYGKGVSIHDVAGLHKVIGHALARQPKLTGAQLRFLRKEMGMSQSALAALIGTSEQNVSLWERRGQIPKTSDRLIKVLYVEHIGGNEKIRELIDRINALDANVQEKLEFEQSKQQHWREAA
jgi:DNA-binding transcriptional regulator YiaG